MKSMLALISLLCAPAFAATITVTSLDDAGTGTLRDAVTQANANAGPDEIVFAPAIKLPGVILLQTALPDVTEDLTITGPATGNLFVERDDMQPEFRLFTITAGAVQLTRLWLGNGAIVGAGSEAEGGGIRNDGTLTITECLMFDCYAIGENVATGNGGAALGGAIYSTGDVTIRDSVIINSAAFGGMTDDMAGIGGDASGGGIYLSGAASLTIQRSGLGNCRVDAGGNTMVAKSVGAASGAGVYASTALLQDTGLLRCRATADGDPTDGAAARFTGAATLRRCSITDTDGVGLATSFDLLVENSTFSGCFGVARGAMVLDGGSVQLVYSTISENAGADSGGVAVLAGTVSVEGCIIADNSGTSPDVEGAVTDLDNNLIGDASGSLGFNVSLLVGTQANPLPAGLEPLDDSLFTQFHAPTWGSFAIDRGGATAPFDDQRRANRLFGGTADIGAIEFIVNQAPSFTPGSNVRVDADSDTVVISGWASGITAGAPWESGQDLRFDVSGPRSQFDSAPSIDPTSGDLRFRPKRDAEGTFTFSVRLFDDGGTANGGEDTSPTRQLVIRVDNDDDKNDNECTAGRGGHAPLVWAALLGVAVLTWRGRRRSA